MRKMIFWVVGLLVGAVFVIGGGWWYLHIVAKPASDGGTGASATVQEQARKMAAAAQERLERAKAELLEATRSREEIEAQRAAAQKAEAARREAAWARFYVPSPFCKDPDNRITMECANEHARAKKEFDRKWAAREL